GRHRHRHRCEGFWRLHSSSACTPSGGKLLGKSLALPRAPVRLRLRQKTSKIGETMGLQPYRVSAYNTSKFSENKIHDDTVARKFGFSGGLVPGVDVLAYMLHMPVAKWGRAF